MLWYIFRQDDALNGNCGSMNLGKYRGSRLVVSARIRCPGCFVRRLA